jgi:hypothetical protein
MIGTWLFVGFPASVASKKGAAKAERANRNSLQFNNAEASMLGLFFDFKATSLVIGSAIQLSRSIVALQ